MTKDDWLGILAIGFVILHFGVPFWFHFTK